MGNCFATSEYSSNIQKNQKTEKIQIKVQPKFTQQETKIIANQFKTVKQTVLKKPLNRNYESERPKPDTTKQIHSNYQSLKQSPSQIFIKMNLINKKVQIVMLEGNKTVQQLKNIICETHCDQLLPDQMVLEFKGRKLRSNQKLSQIGQETKIQIMQKKAEIWQIDLIQHDANRVDEISGEKGVAIMNCGHHFSRQSMIGTIKYQVDVQKNCNLTCPNLNKQGFVCNDIWYRPLCRFVAGFTKKEMDFVQNKLSQNWKKAYSKQCPKCGYQVTNVGLQVKKVECPKCYQNFCYQCRQTWIWNSDSCQSDACNCSRKLITEAPWTRAFMMYRMPDTEAYFQVKVPDIRACPKCKNLIKNVADCKHTSCPCTTKQKYSFCFVCLNLAPEDGERWACGGGYQYCGRVAPNQTLEDLRVAK